MHKHHRKARRAAFAAASLATTFAVFGMLGFARNEGVDGEGPREASAGPPAVVDACGGAGVHEDFETRIELLASSTTGQLRVVVVSDNRSSTPVTVAHALQVVNSNYDDLLSPLVTDASASPAHQVTRNSDAVLDVSRLQDGYYHLLAHTMREAETPEKPTPSAPRTSSAQLYFALEAGRARVVDFTEWYEKSGANRFEFETPVGPPTGELAEFLSELAEKGTVQP